MTDSLMDNTETTINAYDQHALGYAEKFMRFKSYHEKISLFQQKYIPGGHCKILDMGCGPGNNAKILYEKNSSYEITGVDLSQTMTRLATANAPACKFIRDDIRTVHFEGNAFDAIIASFCIVHLSDKEAKKFLIRMARFLRPGGHLYLSFMQGKTSGFETTTFSEDEIWFNYFRPDVVKDILRANAIEPLEELESEYSEQDGSITKDIFIFGRKNKSCIAVQAWSCPTTTFET
jgi:ubiquinone/menaquinone biosynthesis C-methylase UbiE